MVIRTVPVALLAMLLLSGGAGGQAASSPEDLREFEQSVRPILAEHCFRCHGEAGRTRGGLDLTTRAGALKGGDLGPVIDEGFPEASALLEAINYEGLEMPPSGKLDPSDIEILARWVERKAPYGPEAEGAASPEAGSGRDPAVVTEADRRFWSFRQVERPEVPAIAHESWVNDPIDAFVLRGLEEAGLSPAPPASKVALIRRLSFDLLGLPPSPEQVDAFLADDSPTAYEALVDRLLASPHYGERWGRHWLDLVRFAETNSFERDRAKPFAWRYRDYVIDVLNRDIPYDRFVREQLAGDELDEVTADSIIATGFYRLGSWDDEPTDPLQARFDELDDIVTTTAQAFLGLTINCARCHDHKIDPIPQRDYYRFLALLRNLKPYSYEESHVLTEIAGDAERAAHDRASAERRAREAEIEARLAPLEAALLETVPEPRRSRLREGTFEQRRHVLDGMADRVLSDDQRASYRDLIARWEAIPAVPPLPMALSARESRPEAPETFILIRGGAHAPGDKVEPGFPEVLGAPEPAIPSRAPEATSSGRRRALADWIASPENPLTSRVIVNRIWHYHFGRGIVRTPSDFGFQGARPTHPDLLDWLASEFVAGGWRLKPLHRRIVTSSTYRMSSRGDAEALAADPENDLLWRFDPRRLEAEELRDAMLTVTGRLNPEMGGRGSSRRSRNRTSPGSRGPATAGASPRRESGRGGASTSTSSGP